MQYTSLNIRTWAKLGSSGAFGIAACELPEVNAKAVVLTSDLCFFSGLERFKKAFPQRLYNVGIAEQNMVGVAAGFAAEGFVPFATTYASFAASRCLDQVRVNMGYMGLNIKLVGLTAGLSVGILGATHISIEDIAVMRSIPGMTVLSPADCTETVKATFAAAAHKGPVYLRLTGEMGNPPVYAQDYEFEIGRAIRLRDGEDISILATGSMVHIALKVADLLEQDHISCQVVDMHTIKPMDATAVDEAAKCRRLVTLEEHSIIGGLGGSVAEIIADKGYQVKLLRLGINDRFSRAASYKSLLDHYGLTVEKVFAKIKENIWEERSV